MNIVIPTTGKNIGNILASLTSIVMADAPSGCPYFLRRVLYSVEAGGDGFSEDYTFRHLRALAELRGISIQVLIRSVDQAGVAHGFFEGIRALRRDQSDPLITMGDDVILEPSALAQLISAYGFAFRKGPSRIAFICGAKMDIMNDRQYPDFTTDATYLLAVRDYCSTHTYVRETGDFPMLKACRALDTGFAIFQSGVLSSDSWNPTHYPALLRTLGGEDTYLGAMLLQQFPNAYFAPFARAWHLNNPGSIFAASSIAARKEFLKQLFESRGIASGEAILGDAFRNAV